MAGKNMNYYLIDGIPNGRIKCTLANWTGIVYRIPRVRVVDCNDIGYLKNQSGVYFLFFKGDGDNPLVYVGQSGTRNNGEGILCRLKEHLQSSNPVLEDWYEVIVFTTSNDSLSATEISWLENHFYKLAFEIGRYAIKNIHEPNKPTVGEEKESELFEYADYAKTIMGVLGHMVFEPLTMPRVTPPSNSEQPVAAMGELVLKQGKRGKQESILAYGQRTNEGFVVLKGSRISTTPSDKCPKNAIRQREAHAAHITSEGALTEDILLKSANEAAGFVVGTAINAQWAWQTLGGKTLKELEATEAERL